ncbi:uncharacterized protein ISCGN_011867 [Ixodes scapularis]
MGGTFSCFADPALVFDLRQRLVVSRASSEQPKYGGRHRARAGGAASKRDALPSPIMWLSPTEAAEKVHEGEIEREANLRRAAWLLSLCAGIRHLNDPHQVGNTRLHPCPERERPVAVHEMRRLDARATAAFLSSETLVNRANEWLKENPTWEVKTCESVEFKTSSEVVNTERMTYYEYGEQSTRYVRSLRLWLVPRLDQSRPPQQIEYRNLIPQQTGHAGLFGMPTFETLHELLERYNQQLRYQPMPGRVLAVETQEMKIPSYSNFDPDRSYWSEYGGRNRHFLFVVRVFYELGSAGCEEIGVADFVPQCTTTGGLFSFPRYEPFCNVIGRSAQWCSQQRSLRFCNAQSLEVKLKSVQRWNRFKEWGKSCHDQVEEGGREDRALQYPNPVRLSGSNVVPGFDLVRSVVRETLSEIAKVAAQSGKLCALDDRLVRNGVQGLANVHRHHRSRLHFRVGVKDLVAEHKENVLRVHPVAKF